MLPGVLIFIKWVCIRAMKARHLLPVMLSCLGGLALAQSGPIAGVDPEFAALIERCAPTVHPETMAAVISAESRGHQFAIADAGPVKLPWSQRKAMVRSFYFGTVTEAVAKAKELIASGHTVSLGFTQINDRNLPKLGLSLSDVFDQCTNVRAGGSILTEFYIRAVKVFGPGPRALRAAISGYNSGDWMRGEKDGYVDLVYKQAGRPLAVRTGTSTAAGMQRQQQSPAVPHLSQPPAKAFAMSVTNYGTTE